MRTQISEKARCCMSLQKNKLKTINCSEAVLCFYFMHFYKSNIHRLLKHLTLIQTCYNNEYISLQKKPENWWFIIMSQLKVISVNCLGLFALKWCSNLLRQEKLNMTDSRKCFTVISFSIFYVCCFTAYKWLLVQSTNEVKLPTDVIRTWNSDAQRCRIYISYV